MILMCFLAPVVRLVSTLSGKRIARPTKAGSIPRSLALSFRWVVQIMSVIYPPGQQPGRDPQREDWGFVPRKYSGSALRFEVEQEGSELSGPQGRQQE